MSAGCWDEREFDEALKCLRDAGTIDGSDRSITSEQLAKLITAARRDGDGRPELTATFRHATFKCAADFSQASFRGKADFSDAIFERSADFTETTFEGEARFDKATFKGEACFENASFARDAHFPDAVFACSAQFRQAVFSGYAHFPKAPEGDRVKSPMFKGPAEFVGADLKAGLRLGPALALGDVVLDNASLGDVDMRLSGCRLSCQRTRFHEPAHIKVRWAEVQLEDAVFDKPSTLAFLSSWDGASEEGLGSDEPAHKPAPRTRRRVTPTELPETPRLTSLSGADVGNLTLADINLSSCHFESTLRLDGLRLATPCQFDHVPAGLCRGRRPPFLWVWTERMTIHEERCWRASTTKRKGWHDHSVTRQCAERARRASEGERLAKIYRALRKGREDEGNAPGAGDFYYGEMEMRRNSAPLAEKCILILYWLISGYGLRATRALLALTVTVAVLGAIPLDLWGFDRDRAYGRALLFSLESSISLLRAPETKLTAGGEVVQIFVRLAGPLFFGFALLALRGRVKR